MVARVTCTKLLGVSIDEKLKWANHIKSINTGNENLQKNLNKAKKYINLSTLVTLYHSFIYPYLIYCLEVWGGAGDVHLLSLFKLDWINWIMKSIPHRAHTEPICLDLQL